MFVKANDYEYLICRKSQPSLNEFLNEAGIREGSFAATIFSKIYDGFYTNTLELQALYNKYYSKEYDSFAAFLKKKQRYDNDIIQSILKCIDDDLGVYLIKDKGFLHSIELLLEDELSWVLDIIKGYKDED